MPTPTSARDRAEPGPCAVTALPKSTRGGTAPAVPEVAVAAGHLCFQGKPVAPLTNGWLDPTAIDTHLIVPLGDAITTAKDTPKVESVVAHKGEPPRELRPARILAPATLPFEALVDILYTTGRNEFRQYYLGVAGAGGEPAFLRVDPPVFLAIDALSPSVKVYILVDGLRVVLGTDEPRTVPLADGSLPTSDPARWDLAALDRVLGQIEGVHPEVVHATITAEREIPIGVVVAVFDVAAGEGCPAHTGTFEVAEDRCRFPYLIIEAGAG
jgi:hypothetical protein